MTCAAHPTAHEPLEPNEWKCGRAATGAVLSRGRMHVTGGTSRDLFDSLLLRHYGIDEVQDEGRHVRRLESA